MTNYTIEQLEEMLKSDNKVIRAELAIHGYGLDILVNDSSWYVRFHVAKHGFGLDVLIDDENRYVSDIANKLIKYNNHKVIAHNFGTYSGNLHLHYNNKNDYLIISGCYETNNIDYWKIKCEEQLDIETSEKYSELILKELNK